MYSQLQLVNVVDKEQNRLYHDYKLIKFIQLLTWDNVLLMYFVPHPLKDPEMIHPCYWPKKVTMKAIYVMKGMIFVTVNNLLYEIMYYCIVCWKVHSSISQHSPSVSTREAACGRMYIFVHCPCHGLNFVLCLKFYNQSDFFP